LRPERLRPAPGGGFLVLVVEGGPERMMGVVRFGDHVGDGELDLVHPEAGPLLPRGEAEPRSEVVQDEGDLADHDVAVDEVGRREGGCRHRLEKPVDDVVAGYPRDVPVRRAGVLEGKAHELAPALYPGPVIEVVWHAGRIGWWWRCRRYNARYSRRSSSLS